VDAQALSLQPNGSEKKIFEIFTSEEKQFEVSTIVLLYCDSRKTSPNPSFGLSNLGNRNNLCL
jgi:hypothetical protein